MVGESTRSVQYGKSRSATLGDLQQAFTAIGRVTEVNEALGTITGKCRYGLQSVKLRVAVIEEKPDRCVIQIQGFGDDVWGGGARKGTDKLLNALSQI